MVINKDSTVYIMENYPLSKDDLGTLTFSDEISQNVWYIANSKNHYTGLSYVRDNKVIRINEKYADVMNCNYLFFKNVGYSSKWIYCFINDVEYINDNSVNVTYEIDQWQTYLFEKEIGSCFVEREHVNEDSIGLHTIPENLETGEVVITSEQEWTSWAGVVVWAGMGNETEITPSFINNVYTSLSCYSGTRGDTQPLDDWIRTIPVELLSHAVVIPEKMINSASHGVHSFDENIAVAVPQTLDGYEPKNKKLLTYPYMYCAVDNYCGEANIYHVENFYQGGSTTVGFTIHGIPYPKPTMMCYPLYYRKCDNMTDEGLIYDNFPLCSLLVDSYAQWIATNGWSNALALVGSGALAVGSIATGNVIGAMGGISGVVGSLSERVAHEKYGKSLKGGVGNGSINCDMDKLGFRFRSYSIKSEYAEIIDRFFSRYGYQVNNYKVPNTNNRGNVNYVKTNKAIVKGKIPSKAKIFMEECLNNGMSFWHNPSRVGENN
jgi:hypothetical protein